MSDTVVAAKSGRVSEGYIPQKRFFSFLFGNKIRPLPLPEERKPYPLYHANVFSLMFFTWILPVMKTGYTRTLQPEDLWYLDEDIQVETLYKRFQLHLDRRTGKARDEHYKEIQILKKQGLYNSDEDEGYHFPKYSVVWALWDTFKWEYSFALLCSVLNNITLTLNPLIARALINFVEDRSLGKHVYLGRGIGYAVGSTLLVIFAGIVNNHFVHSSMMVGAKAKAVLTKAILEKSFKLNSTSRHNYPVGKITSIMTTDLSRVDLAIGYQPITFAFPVLLVIAIVLLIVNIGVSGLTGVALLIVAISVLLYSSTKLFALRKKVVKFTDKRIGYMKELLGNMKIIKFYSWEPSYFQQISQVRNQEMKFTLKMQMLRSTLTAVAVSLPQVSSMVSFLVMYAVRGTKNSAEIFSSLSLFNVLAQQANNLPLILATGSDALIGIFRVREFLECGEIDQEEILVSHEDISELKEQNLSIKTESAFFKWKTFDDTELERQVTLKSQHSEIIQGVKFSGLHDINIDIKKGEFIVITGLIGSGKSSLLHALAGFMHKEEGSLKINGSLLLCGQPWIQNATVRANITFGNIYDKEKYELVIKACCLQPDLDVLPLGDMTEIGERGITLSGGQKARINMARAVYAEKDIILLDDVLSAVDAKVGKDIVDLCLLGVLQNKTRVLATHQLSLIGSADRIIFLNGDGSIDIGTFNEMLLRNKGFSELMEFSQTNSKNDEDEEEEEGTGDDESLEIDEKESSEKQKTTIVDGRLVKKEERAVNSIKFDVYRKYVQLGSGFLGPAFFPVFVMSVVLATFTQIFTNNWLSFWASEKFDRPEGFYIGLYIMFTFLTVILIVTEFSLLVSSANRSSKFLNIKAVEKILKVPMSYIDVTPMGRVLNRFSKDTDSLDNEIVEQLRLTIYQGANIIGVIILCIIYLPWFAIAVPFLLLIYIAMASFYQASSREVKRLEAVQRSFVYNNFNETLTGMATIQAYKADRMFLEKNSFLTDNMNEAYFITIANQRWLGVNLTLISGAFTFLITMLSVTRQFKISASATGLLVSYVLQIPNQLSLLIRSSTRVEIDMNSAERMYEYAYDLQTEALFEISETKPRDTWPERGCISFQNVSLSYRPELPLVLKNISFEVKQNEKIGICGRTGAGKSSIMTALYRLAELQSGKLIIDGVDVSKIGLRDLRSKLSIIPQDPVLFPGTVRSNLDPFGYFDDEALWDSLRRSGLIPGEQLEKVKYQTRSDLNLHKFHLEQIVEDEGTNFSLGEKQLIALARAVVRNSKILVLDEATSSVDYETDSKIQAAIAREFTSCTILCIAHRLKTIINYDQILVLDKGEVAEFDTPWNLFKTQGGIFQQMCERSEISESDFKNVH